MFGSTVLDVVIGLGFVFFVFSLLVSGINELVRKLFNTRSKVLWGSISRMLDEGDHDYRQGVTVRVGVEPKREAPGGEAPVGVAVITPETPATPSAEVVGGEQVEATNTPLFEQLFNHPLISRLDPTPRGEKSRITHIPPREFARAMVDILAPRDEAGAPVWDQIAVGVEQLPSGLRSQFEVILQEAQDDIKEFRLGIEGWFDSSMERVSDWYKKRSRKAMFAYGLLVAGLFNVSAVVITADLYEDQILRETVVSLAERSVAASVIDANGDGSDTGAQLDCSDRACIEEQVTALVETRLPVLWRSCPVEGNSERPCGFESGGRVVASLVGWVITAAALAMGASFWFSILRKAFKLREQRA
jgi:hypothetical protein